MTAFAINSGGTTDWDSLSGGSVNATLDTYTISNASTLRINTDSYQCANHSAAFGSLDNVGYAGIGGKCLIDPTAVRVIPFDTGSGNVPAIGTTISQGGVSGALLGVWADWQSEPLAAGAAMPAAGYIKIKSVTGDTFGPGALIGIGASATGPDVQGWIEVRGADTAAITVPRIGQFEVKQAWFELGTTSGSRGQIIACPTTGTASAYIPGIWIETAAGSGVYERYCSMGARAASAADPTDKRGLVFWQTTAGIRIGNDGTNNVGYLPPAGCKVRVPAVLLTCCTRTAGSGSGPRVAPNATLATRQEFVTNASGDVAIDGAMVQWYANFVQPYRLVLKRSCVLDTMTATKVVAPLDVDDVIVSTDGSTTQTALTVGQTFSPGVIANSTFARLSLAASGQYVAANNYSSDVTFSNVRCVALTNRGHAVVGTLTNNAATRTKFYSCEFIGARCVFFGGGSGIELVNCQYADRFSGQTDSTYAQYAIDVSAGLVRLMIDGVGFMGLPNVHPYSAVIRTGGGCSDVTIRNIGTFASPLDLGSANASGYLYSSAQSNERMRIQRCYVVNTRIGLAQTHSGDIGVIYENSAGDYSDTTQFSQLEGLVRGVGVIGGTLSGTAVFGTHWADKFASATTGLIEVFGNEPTVASAAQCQVTGGSALFDAFGNVLLVAVGDQVTWEMPYFALGHTAAADAAPTLTGTNTANLSYEFQYALDGGYNGTWLALSRANWFAVGAIDPATGIRLKIRATCVTASVANALAHLRLYTETTSAAQSTNLYPLEAYTLTLTGLVAGSDIVVLAAGTETLRDAVDAHPGTSYGYVYETPESVDIAVYKPGQIPFFIRNYALGAGNASLPVAQVADATYVE